ncbi:MAG TPA: hypothetical protein V6D17_06775 [Candidatus Obscuribacterales bacterium]
MSSKRYLLYVLAGMFVGTATQALAGSHSILDPYVGVQAPTSSAKAKNAQPAQAQVQEPTTTSTYVRMPMSEGGQPEKSSSFAPAQSNPGGHGLLSGVKQIQSGCASTVKAAGSSIVNSTKAATNKVVAGGKYVGNGIASGTKKIGGGIATGAKASSDYLVKGAKVIGKGFKTTGEKMKDGTQAVGSKVAALPKLFSKGGADKDLKVRQAAIASNAQIQPKADQTGVNAVTQGTEVKQMAARRGEPGKLAAVTSSFGRALGKFKFFGKGGQQPTATAASPSAVPQ